MVHSNREEIKMKKLKLLGLALGLGGLALGLASCGGESGGGARSGA